MLSHPQRAFAAVPALAAALGLLAALASSPQAGLMQTGTRSGATGGEARPQQAPGEPASPPPLPAPLRPDLADLLMELGGIPSPTGEEAPLRDALRRKLAAAGAPARVDGLGNLLVGQSEAPAAGGAARPPLVLLALDDPTYAVSGIEAGGWLRVVSLDRAGSTAHLSRHLAGSLAWVIGEAGAAPAVFAIPSIHLQRGRAGFPPPAGDETLYVDAGAASPREVAELGIARLDRVVPRMLPARLAGDRVAGYGSGRRAAAAALLEAAGRGPGLPPAVAVAQARFGGRGLQALRERLAAWTAAGGTVLILTPAGTGGRFEVASAGSGAAPDGGFTPAARALAEHVTALMGRASVPQETILSETAEQDLSWPLPEGTDAVALRFPVQRPGTLGETVDVRTVVALADLLAGLAPAEGSRGGTRARTGSRQRDGRSGGEEPRAEPGTRGEGNGGEDTGWEAPVRIFPVDPAQPFAHMPPLMEAVGVSGHEREVRATLRRLLPARYAAGVREDASGNLVLDLGAGAPHLLFVAHMDETGYLVKGVDTDGLLQVDKRGGFYDSAVVDRPVWVHRAGQAPAEGVMVLLPENAPGPAAGEGASGPAVRPARSEVAALPLVETYPQERLRVDLGAASAEQVAAMGIAPGDAVTVRKQFQPLGDHRAAGRAVDDRAGCAALIAVLHRLARTPAAERGLPGRVTFAWVTREEIGLEGAAELAERLRPDLALAVDTFVSSDSPLEQGYFSLAPLGEGAVLRAADSSNLTPLVLVRQVRSAAAAAGIPLQSGASRGGNDGSVFARHGTPDLPLSWPGRYSHSAVEVIDSRDHDALADLILLLALEPPQIQAK